MNEDELDKLFKVFRDIDINLKNGMIQKRVNLYNPQFDYAEFVQIIKSYIKNYNVIRATTEDELVRDIKTKANAILSSTKEEYFDVHSFTNNAIFLMEHVPNSENKEINAREVEELFYKYLLSSNYPQEVLQKNIFKIIDGKKIEYDIAIQDAYQKTIAFIEIKSQKNDSNLSKLISKVRGIYLFDKMIQFYLVIYLQDRKDFIYILLDNNKEVRLENFPTYRHLLERKESNNVRKSGLF